MKKEARIKNVIFDLGAVMFAWNPDEITKKFTDNVELQKRIQSGLYYHQDWIDFDNALMTEQEVTKRTSERLKLSLQDTEALFEQTKLSLVLISETLEVLKKLFGSSCWKEFFPTALIANIL